MTEPRRLLDGEGSELERALLRAGRDEKPRSRARFRAAWAVAAATGASLAARLAWATGWSAGLAGAAPVVLSAALLGGTTWGIVRVFHPPATAHEGRAAIVAPASSSGSVEKLPSTEPVLAASSEEAPRPAPEATASAHPRDRRSPSRGDPVAPDSVADQVRWLDSVRRELAGRPERALQLLDDYGRRYPRGNFGEEAMLLRVDALLRNGQRKEAVGLAQQFRTTHPGSPYLRRLDSLVADR